MNIKSAIISQGRSNRSKSAAPVLPAASGVFRKQFEASAQESAPTPGPSALRPLTPMDMIPGIKGPFSPLKPLNPSPVPLKPLGKSPFDPGHPKEPKTQHEKIQETARKLVAQTFYAPMLKQMRESPFKSPIFSGGRGGQAFSSMLDQRLAEHMSRSADSKLVRSITRKLEAKGAYQQQTLPKSSAAADNLYKNVRTHVAPGLRA
jgi:hypothetical protein